MRYVATAVHAVILLAGVFLIAKVFGAAFGLTGFVVVVVIVVARWASRAQRH